MNEIINGDCLEVMPKLKDGCIDMVFCDLPYGVTKNRWDSQIPLGKLWELYDKIMKPRTAVVLTAQTPFDKVLGVSNLKNLRYEWIWNKELVSGFLNANRMPMKQHENVLVFYKKLPTYNPIKTLGVKSHSQGTTTKQTNNNYSKYTKVDNTDKHGDLKFPTTILNFQKPHPSKSLHPTQKPVELVKYFIKTYTDEGDIVLDNCSGSGTTAIACLETGRKYICIEQDREYYQKSLERVEEWKENNR